MSSRITPNLSLGGTLARILGVWLWQQADDATLPIGAEHESPSVGGGSALPKLVLILGIISLLGSLAFAHQFNLGTKKVLFRDPGTPIKNVAENLERGNLWTNWVPGVAAHRKTMARDIRAGIPEVESLVDGYAEIQQDWNSKGLLHRVLRADELAEDLQNRLGVVRRPWHRGSQAYQEIESTYRRYRELSTSPPETLAGRVLSAPNQSDLAISMLRAGSQVRGTPRLGPGKEFELPVVPETQLRFSEISKTTGKVVDSVSFNFLDWPKSTITFPGTGSRFVLALPELDLKGAPLPDLSQAARAEL